MRFSTTRTYAVRSLLVGLGAAALVALLRYFGDGGEIEVSATDPVTGDAWSCRILNQNRFQLRFPVIFIVVMMVVGPLLSLARTHLGMPEVLVGVIAMIVAVGMIGGMVAYLVLPQGDVILRGAQLTVEPRFRTPVGTDVRSANIDVIRWQRVLEGTGPYTVGPMLRVHGVSGEKITIGAASEPLTAGLPEDAGVTIPPSFMIDPEDFRQLITQLESVRGG